MPRSSSRQRLSRYSSPSPHRRIYPSSSRRPLHPSITRQPYGRQLEFAPQKHRHRERSPRDHQHFDGRERRSRSRDRRSRSRERIHHHHRRHHERDQSRQRRYSRRSRSPPERPFRPSKTHRRHQTRYDEQRPILKSYHQERELSEVEVQKLSKYEHDSFAEDQNMTLSADCAVWNYIISYGLRPKKAMIVCQDSKRMTQLYKSCHLKGHSISIIAHNTSQMNGSIEQQRKQPSIKELIDSNDVILTVQERSSVLISLQEDIKLFNVVVNYGRSNSVEYYSTLPQLLGEYGRILTIFEDKRDIERFEGKLKVKFNEFAGSLTSSNINDQIFANVQFLNQQNVEQSDLALLKTLPYNIEETALRLFALLKQSYEPVCSIYLKRQGYVTMQLHTDTEFNSIKYIWNFIREEMSPSMVKNIRDMQKFQNQRGVVFNVPVSDLSKWEAFEEKIYKNQKKFKGYKLSELIGSLPTLEDTESEQYKIQQKKKEDALKNRHKLELFIAGVPYHVNEVQIRKFFKEKGINLFLVRILRDPSGLSKGISFGLAENEEHFERALGLNGHNYGDRVLRIKLADQRQK